MNGTTGRFRIFWTTRSSSSILPTGVRALLDLCMFAEASRHQEEIGAVGDAGKVECFIPDSTVTIGRRTPGWQGRMTPASVETHDVLVDPRLLRAGHHHGSTCFEQQAFVEAIRRNAEPVVSLADGLMAVAMGVAAERSVAERRVVEMAEVLD